MFFLYVCVVLQQTLRDQLSVRKPRHSDSPGKLWWKGTCPEKQQDIFPHEVQTLEVAPTGVSEIDEAREAGEMIKFVNPLKPVVQGEDNNIMN